MMRARRWLLAALLVTGAARAIAQDDGNELAAQIGGAQVTLAQALKIGQARGKPVAARFEVEEGDLRIAVFANTGKDTSKLIVDPVGGAIRKQEAVTDPHGIKKARGYSEAVAHASLSLEAAIKAAEADNEGSQVVGIAPVLVKGRAIARVTLLRGTDLSVVEERLQ